ncbi:ATP-dependent DNA helicase RecG [Pacificimonas flava]|uniref:Probable DNA 3'-5' helicase RecG n=2 Tax=Pacificimonas TaxID=1960290 RepID=A0A219B7E3_9SPHN|nr:MULTISPECIES: ATP-dependent DNA helicase RecG [Pacificimonas]MBZ6378705.1 ATP-dependent DNA helicase RecG [Pacificimonas aurantium]OWV34026.1 ATP-dependent DNA helicase RecG [Pacificimonas flava]
MRPDILNPLFAAVGTLDGVGPRLTKQLARLRIERVIDLVYHLPAFAITRRRVDAASEAAEGDVIAIHLTAERHEQGNGRRPSRIVCRDPAGAEVTLVYFHDRGGYALKQFPVGQSRLVSGKLDLYGDRAQIVHPDFVVPPEEADALPEREPVYPLTEGVTNKRMRTLVDAALKTVPGLTEWADPGFVERQDWHAWADTLRRVHALEDEPGERERLSYDELLANQAALLVIRQAARRRKGRSLTGDGALLTRLKENLPYRLTGAQDRSIGEILGDLGADTPMLRLLQGDVGSGKTAVALAAMLRAVEAGCQAAMLAPTEILARQHLESLREMLAGMDVRTAILTGRDKGKARDVILAELAAGHIDILVGTHAIFQDAVSYKDLGLVIVDEQHRFGVNQRMALTAKAKAPPHLLVMTATPIPRTLTLTQFGEMDESRLDQMPPGREPVETAVISMGRLDEVAAGVGRLMDQGGRAYWVCPLVSEEDMSGESAAAETRAAALARRFGKERVGLVHGQMPGPEKDAVMAKFAAGDIQLLVATTVIEVGVNVPEATLMVIEKAESFGLAQLHQLRGRVGRGGGKSSCVLLRSSELSDTARERLKLMRATNDGFEIAEKDLELRGGGELLGTRQSGQAAYKAARAEDIMKLAGVAMDDARLFLEREGGFESSPRAEAMRQLLYLFERDSAIQTLKSG